MGMLTAITLKDVSGKNVIPILPKVLMMPMFLIEEKESSAASTMISLQC